MWMAQKAIMGLPVVRLQTIDSNKTQLSASMEVREKQLLLKVAKTTLFETIINRGFKL
jgi:hypothetical protein